MVKVRAVICLTNQSRKQEHRRLWLSLEKCGVGSVMEEVGLSQGVEVEMEVMGPNRIEFLSNETERRLSSQRQK
jgi:hypothetical protein